MDELDIFWIGHFGVVASTFERRLIAQVMPTIAPGDPLFVIMVMLTRQIYLALGGEEKALLEFGPAVVKRMENLDSATLKISSDLQAILAQVGSLKRGIQMLDAHLIDKKLSKAQRVTERAMPIIDSEFKAMLQWTLGLCFAFIAGVAAVSIWAS
jgi:hypothetical protein